MGLRLVFMGTPEFAVPTLLGLISQHHELLAVYTQPPRPAGRGMAERRSAVHQQAEAFGIPVFTPATLRDVAAQAMFAGLQPDAAVVVAYGLILPKPILDAPAAGCFNLHASLLPRWRGAAPIQRAIMAGDNETGVMVMRMAEGLDTGPVCLAERVPIASDDTAGALHDRLGVLGADLVVRALAALERGGLDCRPQSETGVTYAAKIDKAETRIDWSWSAHAVHDHIRALSPAPGAWCEMNPGGVGANTERVKILRATQAHGAGLPGVVLSLNPFVVACADGAVQIEELQRPGKRPVAAAEFLHGARFALGAMLG